MNLFSYVQETPEVCLPLCVFSSISHYMEIGTELVHLMIKIMPIKRTNNFNDKIEQKKIFFIFQNKKINFIDVQQSEYNFMDIKNLYSGYNGIIKIAGFDNL